MFPVYLYGIKQIKESMDLSNKADSSRVAQQKRENPYTYITDTTTIGILDNKIIPIKTLLILGNKKKTLKVVRFLLPKDALQKYGAIGQGGVYICETINN
jgi:hypothetical protein